MLRSAIKSLIVKPLHEMTRADRSHGNRSRHSSSSASSSPSSASSSSPSSGSSSSRSPSPVRYETRKEKKVKDISRSVEEKDSCDSCGPRIVVRETLPGKDPRCVPVLVEDWDHDPGIVRACLPAPKTFLVRIPEPITDTRPACLRVLHQCRALTDSVSFDPALLRKLGVTYRVGDLKWKMDFAEPLIAQILNHQAPNQGISVHGWSKDMYPYFMLVGMQLSVLGNPPTGVTQLKWLAVNIPNPWNLEHDDKDYNQFCREPFASRKKLNLSTASLVLPYSGPQEPAEILNPHHSSFVFLLYGQRESMNTTNYPPPVIPNFKPGKWGQDLRQYPLDLLEMNYCIVRFGTSCNEIENNSDSCELP